MKHAISILENALYAAQVNEPIHRAAGDAKQARLTKAVGWECLEAIQILKLALAERKRPEKKQVTPGKIDSPVSSSLEGGQP